MHEQHCPACPNESCPGVDLMGNYSDLYVLAVDVVEDKPDAIEHLRRWLDADDESSNTTDPAPSP